MQLDIAICWDWKAEAKGCRSAGHCLNLQLPKVRFCCAVGGDTKLSAARTNQPSREAERESPALLILRSICITMGARRTGPLE